MTVRQKKTERERERDREKERSQIKIYTRLAFAKRFVHTIRSDVGTRINATAMTVPLHGNYPSSWNKSQHKIHQFHLKSWSLSATRQYSIATDEQEVFQAGEIEEVAMLACTAHSDESVATSAAAEELFRRYSDVARDGGHYTAGRSQKKQ